MTEFLNELLDAIFWIGMGVGILILAAVLITAGIMETI